MFLETNVATQVGLFALLPQVADAVSIPVVAAGGVADARGIVAAFALGASGVQIGTAYLFCPEANVSPVYRRALEKVPDTGTAVTNLFSGRPAIRLSLRQRSFLIYALSPSHSSTATGGPSSEFLPDCGQTGSCPGRSNRSVFAIPPNAQDSGSHAVRKGFVVV